MHLFVIFRNSCDKFQQPTEQHKSKYLNKLHMYRHINIYLIDVGVLNILSISVPTIVLRKLSQKIISRQTFRFKRFNLISDP